MSLAVRPPRTSALGVTWCEDLRRGRLGVVKNGGEFMGVTALVENWLQFGGAANNYVRYRKLPIINTTAITILISYTRCPIGSANWSWILTQRLNAVSSEWGIQIRPSDGRIAFYMTIAGTERALVDTDLAYVSQGPHVVGVTWESGSDMLLYVDGEYEDNAGPYAGTITPNVNVNYLCIGAQDSGGNNSEFDVGDPIIDIGRAWSAAEIRNYYRRSMFH